MGNTVVTSTNVNCDKYNNKDFNKNDINNIDITEIKDYLEQSYCFYNDKIIKLIVLGTQIVNTNNNFSLNINIDDKYIIIKDNDTPNGNYKIIYKYKIKC